MTPAEVEMALDVPNPRRPRGPTWGAALADGLDAVAYGERWRAQSPAARLAQAREG